MKRSTQFTRRDITDVRSVRRFLTSLIVLDGLGMAFHPDNDFGQYVKSGGDVSDVDLLDVVPAAAEMTGVAPSSHIPVYSQGDIVVLGAVIDECFTVCERVGQDVYDVSMSIWFSTGLSDI